MALVAVIGSGAWGTALAAHAARMGHAVQMWAYEPEVVAQINGAHENGLYLPSVNLPRGICATLDFAEAVAGAEPWFLRPRRNICAPFRAPCFPTFPGDPS